MIKASCCYRHIYHGGIMWTKWMEGNETQQVHTHSRKNTNTLLAPGRGYCNFYKTQRSTLISLTLWQRVHILFLCEKCYKRLSVFICSRKISITVFVLHSSQSHWWLFSILMHKHGLSWFTRGCMKCEKTHTQPSKG